MLAALAANFHALWVCEEIGSEKKIHTRFKMLDPSTRYISLFTVPSSATTPVGTKSWASSSCHAFHFGTLQLAPIFCCHQRNCWTWWLCPGRSWQSCIHEKSRQTRTNQVTPQNYISRNFYLSLLEVALYLVQLIEQPILRIPNFNFRNLRRWFVNT